MPRNSGENWIGLLSFGFFLLLFALFFIIVPGYFEYVSDFFKDFLNLKPYPGLSNIYLPYPELHHSVVYETVMRFCMVFGVFQFFILALRFYFRSSVRGLAETISNIVIWFGAAYMFYLLFLKDVQWFPFIGGIIAIFGFSIIIRSIVVLMVSMYRH